VLLMSDAMTNGAMVNASLSLLCLAAIGCGSPSPSSGPPEARSSLARITAPNVPAADLTALIDGNTQFATTLHRALAASTTGNMFYSPFDISLDLAVTSVIASGAAIAPVLDFTLPPAQLNPAFDQLDLTLTGLQGATTSGSGQQVSLANAFWSATTTEQATLDTLAQYYGAGVLQGVDPGQAIDSWQATQPGPKLPYRLAGPADLAVVSLISFDAAWKQAFDPAATAPGTFHKPDGSAASVPFMNQEASLAVQTSGTRAVQIPYDGGSLSLLVIVPDDLASFEAGLTPEVIDSVIQGLSAQTINLSLPKLTFQSSQSVLPTLQSLGLPLDSGHYQIWHSARIDVSEAGTQASGMTTFSHTPNAVQTPVPFTVDSPFLFFIRDGGTGTILFTGRIVDPTQTGASAS
jgi:serpin B